MIQEGSRVRLRRSSALVQKHPEMLEAIGVVGSIMRGAALEFSSTMHVRFRELNLVALNVPSADVEPLAHLDPEQEAI